MSGLIQLKAVDVRFGPVTALTDVDLGVGTGERLALIGANGSGKSTLLRVLHGLVKPAAGSVLRDSATRQAMLFQRPYMLHTSVLHNVALPLWINGSRWKQAKEQARLALGRVGLGEAALRNARALSGGQQQRLALARAWSLEPHVLFLDEPTSSLDPHGKREVESLLAEFARGGMTLVFASHNLGQVKRLATRVVYLEQGRVLADLPVQEFFNGSRLVETSMEADLFVKGEMA
jgi:tungstate transport system ATP-binding protein